MMAENVSPVIHPADLKELLARKGVIAIDASGGAGALENYENKHLHGALFVHLDTDLASVGIDAAIGGRHPLPPPREFSQTLGKLGIQPHSYVVIYDTHSGANAAARLWWMLKAAGHNRVSVVNGGLAAIESAGLPLSSQKVDATAAPDYPFTKWALPLAGMEEVENATADNNRVIVDVRDSVRFNGFTEPIDLIAGHIPGAVNIPFANNLDDEGYFLPAEQLRSYYTSLLGDKKPENQLIHCGSGVTACHTILAMAYAGLPIPALYVGSWSEWSRNDKPMILAS